MEKTQMEKDLWNLINAAKDVTEIVCRGGKNSLSQSLRAEAKFCALKVEFLRNYNVSR